MVDVNLSSPIDVRNAGGKALQEALGPVGMVKFMQQHDMGIIPRKNRNSRI